MAKICHFTGKKPSSGHNVSHSVRRTNRRFLPNLHWKRVYDPIKKMLVRVRISTNAMRTLSKPMTKRDQARMTKKMEKKAVAESSK
ncbi:50S ribosomal protein L28 [Candidatus Peregrinibacteria bacterium]|nr:50S ribosomal protein L28 [Candidatus Peregrinibacteria bacterium]